METKHEKFDLDLRIQNKNTVLNCWEICLIRRIMIMIIRKLKKYLKLQIKKLLRVKNYLNQAYGKDKNKFSFSKIKGEKIMKITGFPWERLNTERVNDQQSIRFWILQTPLTREKLLKFIRC